jgi:hypothetical protein
MTTGSKPQKFHFIPLVCAALCVGTVSWASARSDDTPTRPNSPSHSSQNQKKNKKQQPLPPLPSGPTGPVQPIPLDSIAAVPPQVTYENNQLTIVAPNSTLADILRAVRKTTGAEIEIPAAPERVVTNLGPGPAREVVAELLNGSRFNYVLLGSPADDATLTRVVLVAKSAVQDVTPGPAPEGGMPQATASIAAQQPPQPAEAEAEANSDDNNDDSADQTPEAEQQQTPPQDQNGVKTPQQMLQEMQQRQLQMQQQQQQNGQPPLPGPGRPPGPQPQQQDQ